MLSPNIRSDMVWVKPKWRKSNIAAKMAGKFKFASLTSNISCNMYLYRFSKVLSSKLRSKTPYGLQDTVYYNIHIHLYFQVLGVSRIGIIRLSVNPIVLIVN